MNIIIGILAVIALAVLVFRKPSAPAQRISATIYSASDTAGGYGIPPDPALHERAKSVADMISERGPVKVISRSINGLKLSELMTGGPVSLGVPGIGTEGMTVVALEEQLKTDPSQIVVIGAGMVDVLFTEVMLKDYLDMLWHAIDLTATAGKKPVVRGFNRFVVTDLMTEGRLARLEKFDDAVRAMCTVNGIPYLPTSSVEVRGLQDLMPDQVHPTDELLGRQADFFAAELKRIAGL